jgi:signal transduction histidine kinase
MSYVIDASDEGTDVAQMRMGSASRASAVAGSARRRAVLHDALLDPNVLLRPVRGTGGAIRDFVCVAANQSAADYLGMEPDQLVGSTVQDVLPGGGGAGVLELLSNAMETGQPLILEDFSYPFYLLDQERRYDVRVVRLGAELSCTWVDVTQRYEVEHALRRRVSELDAVHEILRLLAERRDLDSALEAARAEVVELFGARWAALSLYREESDVCSARALGTDVLETSASSAAAGDVVAGVRKTGRPVTIDAGGCLLLAVPMVTRSRRVGVLVVARPAEAAPFTSRELTVAQSVADGLAAAVENERLRLREKHQAAVAERQRLARDLHDSATQTIYSANLIAEILPGSWARGPEDGRRDTETLRRLMRTALCEMRTLLYELRPETLDSAPLDDLLERLGEALTGQGEARVHVHVGVDVELPTAVKLVFYRVAQEALTNVAKHAHAEHVRVAVTREGDQVVMTVRDDGRGFDREVVSPGTLGLLTMRERAREVEGDIAIESTPGEGTTVTMKWPGAGARPAGR